MTIFKIALPVLMITVLAASCSKQQISNLQPSSTAVHAQKGREDDDGGIIMHIVLDDKHVPLAGALVTVGEGEHAIHAVTDSNGTCTKKVPYGTWRETVSADGYQSSDTTFSVSDSASVRIIYLRQY